MTPPLLLWGSPNRRVTRGHLTVASGLERHKRETKGPNHTEVPPHAPKKDFLRRMPALKGFCAETGPLNPGR
jgi:hypothetical protein